MRLFRSAALHALTGVAIWFAAYALGWAIMMQPMALALLVTAGAAIGYGFAKFLDNAPVLCVPTFIGLLLLDGWLVGLLDGRAYYAAVLLIGVPIIAWLVTLLLPDRIASRVFSGFDDHG